MQFLRPKILKNPTNCSSFFLNYFPKQPLSYNLNEFRAIKSQNSYMNLKNLYK